MPEAHVLIVSTVADVATDEVIRTLAKRGVHHHRINTEDYPFSAVFAFDPGREQGCVPITLNGRSLPSPTAVWYRRVRRPAKPESLDDGIYTFCRRGKPGGAAWQRFGISGQMDEPPRLGLEGRI